MNRIFSAAEYLHPLRSGGKWRALGLVFLACVLATLTTRGRMGSDDLEVYALAKRYPLVGGDFFDLLATSTVSTIPHRWLWLLIDQLIISLAAWVHAPRLMGYDFDYLACSALPAVAMWLSFLLLNNQQASLNSKGVGSTPFALDPVVVLLFFGTVMIHFFNGSSVESYIILLLVVRLRLDRPGSHSRCLWVDILLVGFKPYYAIVVLALLLHQSPLIGRVFRVGFHLSVCLAIPLGIQAVFASRGFSYKGLPWDATLASMGENLWAMNFGLSFGLFWCYFPAVVLIAFGAKPTRSFLVRLAAVLGLEVFLSTLPYWHGGAPGNRYLSPLFIIFIGEMRTGWSRLVLFCPRVVSVLGLCCILIALPVLEYKNIAYKEYLSGAVLSGKPHGYQDANRDFFPLDSLQFNPYVFAGSVIVLKTLGQPDAELAIGLDRIAVNQIYPGTLPARLDFLARLQNQADLVPTQIRERLTLLGMFGRLVMALFYGVLIVLCGRVMLSHAGQASRVEG